MKLAHHPVAGPALLSLFCAAVCAASEAPSRFDYHDDVDRRRIADVRVDRAGGRLTPVRLTMSATGAGVEPESGFEGVAGFNRYTAEQFRRLLSGSRRLDVRTTGVAAPGRVYAGRIGQIPQRRRAADGAIDYLAVTAEEYPLELVIEGGPLGVGLHDVHVLVDGWPRLRVTLAVEGPVDTVRVVGFESLGPGPADGGLHALLVPLEGVDQEQEKVVLPDVTAAQWAERDMEGKWALYRRLVAERPETRRGWVRFLLEQADYPFLEWLALYQVDGFDSQGVGQALTDAHAPQWPRVALWMIGNFRGYGEVSAQGMFTSKPGPALWWFRKYPQAAEGDLAQGTIEALEKQGARPKDSPHLLPPLKAEEVLAALVDPPEKLEVFGDESRKAEPGVVYEQQVVRAIQGLIASGLSGEPWDARLIALTRHPNATVRREAFLAYTHNKMKAPSSDALEKVVDDAKEVPGVREAALLALSYQNDPRAYLKLHHVHDDLDHPAWDAAVSRLGDLGDGFTLRRLSNPRELPRERAELVQASLHRIGERVKAEAAALAGRDKQASTVARQAVPLRLERAAYAEMREDPMAGALVRWAKATTAEQAQESDAVRRVLEDLRNAGGVKAGTAAERVQRYADEILKGQLQAGPAGPQEPRKPAL